MKTPLPPLPPPAIPDDLVKRIADDASVDVRSVWKRLGGGTLRPLTQRRIDAAIVKRLPRGSSGLAPPPAPIIDHPRDAAPGSNNR